MNYTILIFGVLLLLLLNGKVRDLINIPRSKFAYAKVIYKEHNAGGAGTRARSIAGLYRITFEIDNSRTINLPVSGKAYESVSEGSRGVLVYTNSRFRGFHIDKKIPDLVKRKNKRFKNN
jgi:hypothetical protein